MINDFPDDRNLGENGFDEEWREHEKGEEQEIKREKIIA
jgi:hypothetical protein